MKDTENQLIELNGQQFPVKVKPAVIDFSSVDAMKDAVHQICGQFEDYQVTPDNLKAAKDIKAELNKFRKRINERRILIAKEAKAPITEFENRIKDMTAEIDSTSEVINVQVKEFEQREKHFKRRRNLEYILSLANDAGVNPDKIEYNPKWDNKSFSNFQFEKEVQQQISALEDALKLREDNGIIIKEKADKLGLGTSHYIKMLDDGQSLSIILKQMEDDRQEIDEIAEKQKESKRKEQADLIKRGDKAINRKTGEVVDKVLNATLITKKGKFNLEGTKYQFDQLNIYLLDMGFKITKE